MKQASPADACPYCGVSVIAENPFTNLKFGF